MMAPRKKKPRICISGLWRNPAGCEQILEMVHAQLPHADTSQITGEWWSANTPKASTLLPLICGRCKHPGGIKLEKIVSGRTNFACQCNAKLKWEGEVGRLRLLQRIRETPKLQQVDTSLITPAYWEATHPSCDTRPPLRCSGCGHTCDTAAIKDLKRQGIECYCPGHRRPPWKLRPDAGFDYILRRLAEHINVDASQITREWFRSPETDISLDTILCLKCTKCNEDCSQRLRELVRGRRPFCRCARKQRAQNGVATMRSAGFVSRNCWQAASSKRKRFVWRSKAGYRRITELRTGQIRWSSEAGFSKYAELRHHFQAVVQIEDFSLPTWTRHIKDIETPVECSCLKCGLKGSVRIHSILSARTRKKSTPLVCWCPGMNLRWSSRAGFERFQALVTTFRNLDASAVTWELWREIVESQGRKAILPLVCRTCQYTIKTTLNSLQQGLGFGCWCNSGAVWRGEDGHRKFRGYFKDHGRLSTNVTLEWWLENTVAMETMIPMTCSWCEATGDTSLHSLMQGQGISCRCRHKTEHDLGVFLRQKYGTIGSQPRACHNPTTGRLMRFDFAVYESPSPDSTLLAFVELDGGIGHFGKGWSSRLDSECPNRDFIKEQWALAQGHSVIRLLQVDVWKNRLDWSGFLDRSLQEARNLIVQGNSPRIFVPLGASEYSSGIYENLRRSSTSSSTVP